MTDKVAGHVQGHEELRGCHRFSCRDEEGDGSVRSHLCSYLNALAWTHFYFCRKKDMSGEETMVLSHIQASGNEGILLLDHA